MGSHLTLAHVTKTDY